MAGTFGSYKYVFMLGIDGMGAFNSKTETPNMDKLFKDKAVTYTALASKPTISAQCWTSMLTGAIPEVHGLTNDDMHPIDGLPTIFRIIKEACPDAETAAYSHWSPIVNSIISHDGGIDAYGTGADDDLCPEILEYLDTHSPKMLFIQFDSVDGAGHTHGYGFPGHLERITHVDAMLGQLVDQYKEKGIFDDTLFIVTADHGGTPYGGHGGWSDEERLVFLGVSGKNVMNGEIGETAMRDYPAIVLHALGVQAPDFNPEGYAAQLPVGIFADAGVENRKPLYPKYEIHEHEKRTQPTHDSPEYIGNFLETSRIRFWQTFENGIEDVTAQAKVTTERGIVKTYPNGYIGMGGEFGGGVLKAQGIRHEDVFTFAFWFKTTSDTRWMDILSNKDNEHDSFSIAPYNDHVGIYIKEPDGTQANYILSAVESYEDSSCNIWAHFMFEIDIPNEEINCYVNFKKTGTLKAGKALASHFDLSTLYFAPDQHNNEQFYKIIDDIMIIDGKAPADELKKYYRF